MERRPRRSASTSSDDDSEEQEFESGGSTNDSDDVVYDSSSSSEDEDSTENKKVGGRKRTKQKSLEGKEEIEKNNEADSSNFKSKKQHKKSTKRAPKPILQWKAWEEEHEEWIDENMPDDDLNNQNPLDNEIVETPSDFIMPLLRYQKEWLAWALKQEESPIKGGILADEMGMGKTVQAIALVLAKREISRSIEYEKADQLSSFSKDLSMIKGTLVICPPVAVSQWVSEIERFTLKGSTNVLVYHGANRGRKINRISENDFVISTYSITEAEFRKYVMPSKIKCPYCGKLFHYNRLKFHLKHNCGPGESERESDDTIVRRLRMESLPDGSERCKARLHAVKWERIILDEAHYIKARRSNTARAVLALESSYKWALSGSPIQNQPAEICSLVRFLRIFPYAYYLCKNCDCRVLERSDASFECSSCPHSYARHFCWWNKYITKALRSGCDETFKSGIMLLKKKILKNTVLRRTKKGRAADLALPPRIISVRRDTMDIQEQDYYESLYKESRAQFNTYNQAGTVLNNYAHVFDLLTRLRMALDHPYLVVYSKSSAFVSDLDVNSDEDEPDCGICHDTAKEPVITSCEHIFCRACLARSSKSRGHFRCPSCSKLLTVDLRKRVDYRKKTTTNKIKGFRSSSILNRIRLEDFKTSTKIEALREEIRFMIERDRSAKGIVFSQFTSFLDLINYSLSKSDVPCVQLDGTMTLAQKDAAVQRFMEDPDCKIFLISLMSGGVALNLTKASHVFLMDPWWNPAVEQQAQDRVHRIGQYKPTRTVRFIIANSIEERILKLQNSKELLFEATVGNSSAAMGKLDARELGSLFY